MKGLSSRLAAIAAQFSGIIEDLSINSVSEASWGYFWSGIITLIDGSTLRIREHVGHNGLPVRYSYYWLNNNHEIIVGWDNAPYHKHISTYPHHKHQGKTVGPSHENTLEKVLAYMRGRLPAAGQ